MLFRLVLTCAAVGLTIAGNVALVGAAALALGVQRLKGRGQ
jgi:hypothetical protein